MNFEQLFYARPGALRAPWRIAMFCATSIAGLIVVSVLLGPSVLWLFRRVGVSELAAASWIEVLGVLAGTAVSLRLIDKRPWRDVWLGRDAARPSLFVFGFAIGAAAIGLPIILLIAGHWLRNAGGPTGSWFGAAVRVTLFLAPAALLEELVTRGYILSVLREQWGWRWSIVATSVVFGLLHLANNGASIEPVLLVMLAGFFLASVLYVTQSLYAAWMAHLAWNWTMAVLFHTAVSGYPLDAPAYRYVPAGPGWATGGDWGPEGGIPAGLGMCAGILYVVVRRRRGANEANVPNDATT